MTTQPRRAWVDLDVHDERRLLIALIGLDFGPEPEKRIPDIRESRRGFAEYAMDRCGIGPEHVVLDIGSGCGFGTYWIAKRARHVHAVDISPAYLTLAARECADVVNVSFHLIPSRKLEGIESDSIDRVIAMSVFIHLNPYDVYWYLSELARVTRAGAHVWFDVADGDEIDLEQPNQFGAYFLRQSEEYRDDPTQLAGLMQWVSVPQVIKMARRFGFDLVRKDAAGQLLFRKRAPGDAASPTAPDTKVERERNRHGLLWWLKR